MRWVYVIVFAFMTLITMSTVVDDVQRLDREVSLREAWAKAALWTAVLYVAGVAAWESFT